MVAPDDAGQWMRPWGMLDRQSSSFLAGRPLRVLNVSTYPLRIPDSLQGHVYNPSVAPLPKRLQRELGCEQCTHVLTSRVDWVNACTNRTPGEMFDEAKLNHWAHRGLGRRKMTLVSVVKANWKVFAWGWLQLAPQRPAPQAGRIDEWKVMAHSTTIVDVRPFMHDERLWLIGSHVGASARWESVYAPLELQLGTNASEGWRAGRRLLSAWLSPASMTSMAGKECGGRSQGPFCSHGPVRAHGPFARGAGPQDALPHGASALGATGGNEEMGAARGGVGLQFLSWLSPDVVVCSAASASGARSAGADASVAHPARGTRPAGSNGADARGAGAAGARAVLARAQFRGPGLGAMLTMLRDSGSCIEGPPHSSANCRYYSRSSDGAGGPGRPMVTPGLLSRRRLAGAEADGLPLQGGDR